MGELSDHHHDRENARMIQQAYRRGWVTLDEIKSKIQAIVEDRLTAVESGDLPDRNAVRWVQAGMEMVKHTENSDRGAATENHLHLHGDALGEALERMQSDRDYVQYLRSRAVDDDASTLRQGGFVGQVVSGPAPGHDGPDPRAGNSE